MRNVCSYTTQYPILGPLYTSPPGRPVTLQFTHWQTCYFTLHPLADLLLYTSPHGRPVTLHFNPWQTCYITLHPLADLLLYTSPLGRSVIPTPTRLLWEAFNHGVTTARMLSVRISTIVYSQVLVYTASELRQAMWSESNCPSFETAERGASDVPTTTQPLHVSCLIRA